MNLSTGDPIADLMTALDIASNTISDDARLEQVFTQVMASAEAGDHDKATHVLGEFLRGALRTTAASHPGVLTDAIAADAAQLLVEGFASRHGPAPRSPTTASTPEPSGFDVADPTAGPA
jgi:hypothetical protein